MAQFRKNSVLGEHAPGTEPVKQLPCNYLPLYVRRVRVQVPDNRFQKLGNNYLLDTNLQKGVFDFTVLKTLILKPKEMRVGFQCP